MVKFILGQIIQKKIQQKEKVDIKLEEMKNQKQDKRYLDILYLEKDVYFVDNQVYIYIL